MSRRETAFECSFTQDGEPSRMLVRAWDENQARVQLVAELKAQGMDAPKDVSVQPLLRRDRVRARGSVVGG